MSTSKSSPRNSPTPQSSPSSLLINITKCFDGRNDIIDEPDNIKWGPSHSHDSDDTDPTAPVTTSTNKGTTSSTWLRTGMSESTSVRANNGSGSKTFWKNFHAVSCADSIHRENDENGRLDEVSSPSLHSPSANYNDNHNDASVTTSPSTMLLRQSAKIATQAATSIMTLVESMSARVNNNNNNYETADKKASDDGRQVDDNKKMPLFCGAVSHDRREERKIGNAAAASDLNVNGNGQQSNTAAANDFDELLLCGHDNHCFQHFEYNVFRDNHCDNNSNQNDSNDGIRANDSVHVNSSLSQNNHQPNHQQTAAAITPLQEDTKGYEIRLKSTFSQQQIIKTKREDKTKQKTDLHLLPNLSHVAADGLTSNKYSKQNHHQQQQKPSSSHKNPSLNDAIVSTKATTTTSSAAAATSSNKALPMEYLSIPNNNDSSHNINDTNNTTPLQRTTSEVSELTMRSHAERYQKYASDSRRMAYYAVGHVDNTHEDSDRMSGNRRCYFTGVGIRYGEAFYAGSVRQGPR
jgi:hypothetical protein